MQQNKAEGIMSMSGGSLRNNPENEVFSSHLRFLRWTIWVKIFQTCPFNQTNSNLLYVWKCLGHIFFVDAFLLVQSWGLTRTGHAVYSNHSTVSGKNDDLGHPSHLGLIQVHLTESCLSDRLYVLLPTRCFYYLLSHYWHLVTIKWLHITL